MASMFDLLLELPLFRGVSHSRLAEVVGETKLHFLKFPAGETIARAGEECSHLAFVISGSIRATTMNRNGRFIVGQTLSAPAVITPDFLFGRFTSYPCTVVANESTGILKISKSDLLKILNSDEVFMFNYLNTLSVNAQKALEGILALTSGGLDERIAFWIIALTQPGSYDIKLTCKARDLCSLFAVQRNVFESTLDDMERRGLLTHTSNELVINDRRAMLALLDKHSEPGEDY